LEIASHIADVPPFLDGHLTGRTCFLSSQNDFLKWEVLVGKPPRNLRIVCK